VKSLLEWKSKPVETEMPPAQTTSLRAVLSRPIPQLSGNLREAVILKTQLPSQGRVALQFHLQKEDGLEAIERN